jgi:hypothetical protein
MQSWSSRVLCETGGYRPRQFEYHPSQEGLLLFGTIRGEVVVADVDSGRAKRVYVGGLSRDRHDSILG